MPAERASSGSRMTNQNNPDEYSVQPIDEKLASTNHSFHLGAHSRSAFLKS